MTCIYTILLVHYYQSFLPLTNMLADPAGVRINALPGKYYLICGYQVNRSLAKSVDHISVPARKPNLAVPGGPGSLDYRLLGRIPALRSWVLHVLLYGSWGTSSLLVVLTAGFLLIVIR